MNSPISNSPGPIPARNSLITDSSVIKPNTIIGIDGGIRMPSVPPAAIDPVASVSG